jgi:hypothetical protein
MSATEIIEQIKTLSWQDQVVIKTFAQSLPDEGGTSDSKPMDAEKARQISRRIFAENRELFTKLAQ